MKYYDCNACGNNCFLEATDSIPVNNWRCSFGNPKWVERVTQAAPAERTGDKESTKLLLLGDVDHRVELRYGRKLSPMELTAIEVTFDIMSQNQLRAGT